MYHWRGSTDYINVSLTGQYWLYQCITDGAVLTISMYHWRGSTDYINVSLTEQYWQYQCTADPTVLMYHWQTQQYWHYQYQYHWRSSRLLTIPMHHWRISTDNVPLTRPAVLTIPLTEQYWQWLTIPTRNVNPAETYAPDADPAQKSKAGNSSQNFDSVRVSSSVGQRHHCLRV